MLFRSMDPGLIYWMEWKYGLCIAEMKVPAELRNTNIHSLTHLLHLSLSLTQTHTHTHTHSYLQKCEQRVYSRHVQVTRQLDFYGNCNANEFGGLTFENHWSRRSRYFSRLFHSISFSRPWAQKLRTIFFVVHKKIGSKAARNVNGTIKSVCAFISNGRTPQKIHPHTVHPWKLL